jgi:hypothetical protein
LQQRIVAEVDARHDVIGAKRSLLRLGKEIIDTPVEHQPTDLSNRHSSSGIIFVASNTSKANFSANWAGSRVATGR